LLRSIIATSFADLIGSSQISALDLAAHYRDLSEQLRKMALEKVDDEYGLDLTQLFIVNVSLPEEVEKALDTRSSMGVIGDMNKFQQFQMGKAMTAAAENPGGGAAEGMGLGMGFAMANRMASAAGGVPQAAPMGPPPLPQDNVWHLAINGQSQGPYDTQQLLAGIQAGQIRPETLVWSPTLVHWTPASQVGPLANAFRMTPPPPPPPPAAPVPPAP
jgi:Putative virion core protein (lumpy skin disease virus)